MKPRIDPQRWKQIDDLLDAAIDLEAEKRSSYLDQACGTDQDLRKKVEDLLKSDRHVEDFISLPVLDPASEYVGDKIELYERDVIVDRYELVSRLGTGGMGEIWLAFDLKLRVHVVLKTLHFHLNRTPHRVEALRREVLNARTVISPNVSRIFDLVIDHDREFISMEHIDGMTLAALLKSTGPLPLSKARDIASQFLTGLQVIHDAGLVHCDLKPENIMITHTGRVVVMDFGIAKQMDQTRNAISGTPAYMSPEQLSGAPVDLRSDIFATGIILAEMIHPGRIVTDQTREEIWKMIRHDPAQVADSPWKAVITRAVAAHPNARFGSAAELLRALEEATEEIQTQHERSPYPGLASYRTEDSDYFFGREQEIEAVIKKLKQLHFLALVGASGSGKTSFLRAGLIPALPEGWSCIFCVPADSPHLNLKHALIREFSGDPEAMQQLSRFDEAEVAVRLLHQWRRKYTEAILIIDRFEELFTLNGADVQSRLADLIGTAVVESDIHVLLSMRDDFLIGCHHYPPLAPIFSGLTPLESLSGPSLRRALVQPALKCGYRFEDEMFIEEIVADVEKERGALPLMGFAAAQLWKKRDRESGVLSKKAYKEIGGVGGALAQHAEKTLERIGTEKQDIVREIFRNLITAQNTRAARDTEELLSLFPDQQKAEEVLRILIDARLLTSFEDRPQDVDKPKRRVELIHESLLAAWPRLVRWQTQEAESAQLRDQLRQASQVWAERGRSDDLLWTGRAFGEFELWRQRYPGGLTATENAFAQAMTHHANKNKRKQRFAATTVFVLLLVVAAALSILWRQAMTERDKAIAQAKRAEANKVLALGSSLSDADVSTRLAYALASLELYDTPDARMFALQTLSEGPPALVVENIDADRADFSSNGKWLAVGGRGTLYLIPSHGGPPSKIVSSNGFHTQPSFFPSHELLLFRAPEAKNILKVWDLSSKGIIKTLRFEGQAAHQMTSGKAFFYTDNPIQNEPKWSDTIWRSWDFNHEEPELIGRLPMADVVSEVLDSKGRFMAYTKDRAIYMRSLSASGFGPEKLVGRHSAKALTVSIHPEGNMLVSGDENGEIRFWSILPGPGKLIRVIERDLQRDTEVFWFSPDGSSLLVRQDASVYLWDLTVPEDAEPFVIRNPSKDVGLVAFHRTRPWIAIPWEKTVHLYPLLRKYPYVFRRTTNDGSFNVRFNPDGRSLINGFVKDGVCIWNLPGQNQVLSPNLWKPPIAESFPIDVDPSGKYVLAGTNAEDQAIGAYLISIADGKAMPLKRSLPGRIYDSVSFSPDGKFAAGVAVHGPPEWHGVEIWDLQTGNSRVVEKSKGKASFAVKYAPDGSLFSGDSSGNMYRWNLEHDSSKVWKIGEGIVTSIAITNDGNNVAAVALSAKQWDHVPESRSRLVLIDLRTGKTFTVTSHGDRVFRVAFDPSGSKLITGDLDGMVRVGGRDNESPHLLLGHESHVADVAVDPSGKWIASTEFNKSEVRLWPMPEGQPFHTLPYDEFLNRLHSLTNLRVAADKSSPNGYRVDIGPFPGWEEIPNW